MLSKKFVSPSMAIAAMLFDSAGVAPSSRPILVGTELKEIEAFIQ
jgi:hypothetical protein